MRYFSHPRPVRQEECRFWPSRGEPLPVTVALYTGDHPPVELRAPDYARMPCDLVPDATGTHWTNPALLQFALVRDTAWDPVTYVGLHVGDDCLALLPLDPPVVIPPSRAARPSRPEGTALAMGS